MIEIRPFTKEHIPEAAGLFVKQLQALRSSVPALPDVMENPAMVIPRLEWIIANGGGLAAVEEGRLAGYLTWLVDEEFRGTTKTAAYCPDWGHAAANDSVEKVYRMLYYEATRCWVDAGYQIYALTYLANNHFLDTFLYHNGFGMIVMDAVRPVLFETGKSNPTFKIRKCTLQDAELIAAMDAEHCGYYLQPPTLMTPRHVENAETVRKFLSDDHNAYWLAEQDGYPAGFMRFEYGGTNASRIVRSDKTISITGAFIRPQFRGRGASPAILQAGLAEYAAGGFITCSVDFESINPDAYYFWRKYFQIVCHSVVRCPERYL